MRLEILQARTKLSDEQVTAVKEEVIAHCLSALNAGKLLIEKKVDPEVIRQMMEGYGVSYDGKLKKFV
jgi:hypothetical protein